jgi:hypothetical protein
MHFQQWKTHGAIVTISPAKWVRPQDIDPLDWFARFIIPNGSCWDWAGRTDKDGYGKYHHGGVQRAHRWLWQLLIDPDLPRLVELDHVCGRTCCVRPSHLQPLLHAKHADVSTQRSQALAKAGDEYEWTPGKRKPRSIDELSFALAHGLPVNILGAEHEGPYRLG